MTDLLPNAQYELWVTATNTTGISPASEKTLYVTGNPLRASPSEQVRSLTLIDVGEKIFCVSLPQVPSPPVIKQRECASCPEAALIRWESGNTDPVDSYTVELRETGTGAPESAIAE